MGVDLQIETLILPPAAYPLLQHCPNVEDVVCLINDTTGPSGDEFLRSLMSNRDSKLKRLEIPLALLPNHLRKRSSTLWGSGMVITTDHLRPQNSLLRVQGSPN